MNIDPDPTASIYFKITEHPSVKAARQQVDEARRELDKVDVSLQGGLGAMRANYEYYFHAAWEEEAQNYGTLCGSISMLAIAGAPVAAFIGAGMIPLLAPFRGWMAAGAFVASVKFVPQLVVDRIGGPLVERAVTKDMENYLRELRVETQAELDNQKSHYDQVEKNVTAELVRKAAEEMLRRQSEPKPSADIKIEEKRVTIGGVVVPRKEQEAVGQESAGVVSSDSRLLTSSVASGAAPRTSGTP